jgi:nucleotide-binding universal stress UspA family protein
MKTILIATDGSPASREAIGFGLELASEHAAEVTFVHVAPVLDRSVSYSVGLPAAAPHRIDEDRGLRRHDRRRPDRPRLARPRRDRDRAPRQRLARRAARGAPAGARRARHERHRAVA